MNCPVYLLRHRLATAAVVLAAALGLSPRPSASQQVVNNWTGTLGATTKSGIGASVDVSLQLTFLSNGEFVLNASGAKGDCAIGTRVALPATGWQRIGPRDCSGYTVSGTIKYTWTERNDQVCLDVRFDGSAETDNLVLPNFYVTPGGPTDWCANDPRAAARSSIVNLARNKPTTQSSLGFEGASPRAVDGNRSGNFAEGSVMHTSGDPAERAWWLVDLGAEFDIDSITIANRTDCCADRLNASVAVRSEPSISFEAPYYGTVVGSSSWSVATATGRVRGRYVFIFLNQVGVPLHLAEVEVWGVGR